MMVLLFQTPSLEAIEALTSLIGVLLSGIVAYIYWQLKEDQSRQTDIIEQQGKLQETQTQILKNQERLMQAEYQPLLRVHEKSVESVEGEEQFRFTVSNLGNSIIKRASLDMQIFITRYEAEDEESLMFTEENGGNRIPLFEVEEFKSNGGKTALKENSKDGESIVLPPSRTKKEVSARTICSFWYDNEYFEHSYSEMLDFLDRIGYKTVVFQWVIQYYSVSDHAFYEYVTTVEIPSGEKPNLREAVEDYSTYPLLDEEEIYAMPGPRG